MMMAKAAYGIKTGQRVIMNWDMIMLEYASVNHQQRQYQNVPILGGVAFDDIFTMDPRG